MAAAVRAPTPTPSHIRIPLITYYHIPIYINLSTHYLGTPPSLESLAGLVDSRDRLRWSGRKGESRLGSAIVHALS